MSKLLKEWNRLAFSSRNSSINESSSQVMQIPVSEENMRETFFPAPSDDLGVRDWKDLVEDIIYQANKKYVLIEYTEDYKTNPNSFYRQIQNYLEDEFGTGDGDFGKLGTPWQEVSVYEPGEDPLPYTTHLRWKL